MFRIFSLSFKVFAEADVAKLKKDAEFWALMFLVLGVADGVSLLTSVCFTLLSSDHKLAFMSPFAKSIIAFVSLAFPDLCEKGRDLRPLSLASI